jgi:hypothetical protein
MSTGLFGKDSITGSQDAVALTNNALHMNQYVWDTNTLSWIKQVQSTSSGSSTDVNITNTSVPVSQAGSWSFTPTPTLYSKQYDQVSDTLAYLGDAVVGGSSASAIWRIQKLVFTTAGSVTITFADGNVNFDNVWNNRASLSYS